MSDVGTTNNTDSVVASKLPNGGTLPFPPTPSASVAGRTMQESTYAQRVTPPRLHEDPPNIVVILIDDAGPGLPTTLGGEVRTATMDRICAEGVSYNRFHTTAMCSPTRASLLTGRNHHEIGNGQIAELANDWDGYSGHIPHSSALIAEVLKDYGYSTAAFGKWHNTPAEETTAAGPFENWPTGLGFEYFYGFLAGEASQYEPNLVRNTNVVLPPKTPEEGYHLSEDLADDAIGWLRNHKALQADKPFFMYWASGCLHGPHHVMKEWADKYAGKFDDGWDAYRERVFDRAKEKGWIPHDCELTERDETLASWESIPEDEKPFQRRLMEVAAGYAEHVDVQVGRLADELDRLGYAYNTIFIYIWGDNGSSGEGQNGTIAELLAQNGIPSTVRQHIDALDELGGLDVLGSPLVDNQYHAGWAWAGVTPYKGMKLLASHLGGTRNPMAIRWPKKVTPDPVPRAQFLHCNDLVPTLYEILGIVAPLEVNGVQQVPLAGASFADTLTDRSAAGGKKTQYFEIIAGRSITTAGWPRRSARAHRGCLGLLPGSRPGPRIMTAGSSTTSMRTGHKPTIWPTRCPRNSPRCANCSPLRRRATRCCRSAAACGCCSITPNCGSLRPTSSGNSRGTSPACPSSARQRWAPKTTPSPSRRTCRPTPTACSTRSVVWPAVSPAISTTATSATSTTCSSSPGPKSARPPSWGPDPRPSRWRPATPSNDRPARSISPCGSVRKPWRRDRFRSVRRCCSPRTTASISESVWARQYPWTTTNGHRSRSKATSSASTSRTRNRCGCSALDLAVG